MGWEGGSGHSTPSAGPRAAGVAVVPFLGGMWDPRAGSGVALLPDVAAVPDAAR